MKNDILHRLTNAGVVVANVKVPTAESSGEILRRAVGNAICKSRIDGKLISTGFTDPGHYTGSPYETLWERHADLEFGTSHFNVLMASGWRPKP